MKKMKTSLFTLLCLAIIFSLAIPISSPAKASPATVYVPYDYPTIQEAVSAASPGDTIIVRHGTYTENVDVSKSLTIQSENGAEATIVQAADPNDHVFEVTADYVEISGFTVTGATGSGKAGIYLNRVQHCNIINNNVSNNYYGILLDHCNNNTILNNNASNNEEDGIYLHSSSGNTVKKNTVNNNNRHGIYPGSSSNNSITYNTADNNDSGIALASCSNHTIRDNNVTNNRYGIYIAFSSNNLITNNNASSNEEAGICLSSADNNTIRDNNCINQRYGIFPYDSSNNTVYLNNFINNTENGYSSDSTNTWNSPEQMTYIYNGNTYTSYLGNYWSDYAEKYPDADEADSTGIWDTPYSIDGDSGDNYPLMEPFENYIQPTFDLNWEPKTSMPTSRSWTAAVTSGGKIYVVGGCSSPTDGQQFYNAVRILEVYDPSTDSWTKLSPMSIPRVGPAAATIDGNIYVMGGFNRGTWSADPTVEVYDIATDTWSMGTSMPTGRSWFKAVVLDGKIYTLGGVGYDYYNDCEVYDPVTDSWTSCASFTTGRYLHAVATANGKIYVIGGDSYADHEGHEVYSDIQEYNPLTNTWTTKTPMPTASSGLDAITANNKIWVFGGGSLFRIYDIATDSWTEKTSNQNPAGSFSIAYLGGAVYRFGGGGWGPTLDVVEVVGIGPDTTPPTVSSVTPENGATNVAINTVVTTTFSEAIDSSTITTDSFTLSGSAVSGTVTYDPTTYIATFTPDANLDYNHEYTATLSTAITDEAGNPLDEPYTWSFTTESAPNQPPDAEFTYHVENPASPGDISSGDIVSFDASGSSDPEGSELTYQWDFNIHYDSDGDSDAGNDVDATGRVVSHRFRGAPSEAKSYNVTLTVEDDKGGTDSSTREVTVMQLKKPVVVIHEPTIPIPGVTVFAKMGVSYNWIDERNGENVYIVSRVNLSCDGFAGVYAVNFIDTHSRADPWGTPTVHPLLWWNVLPSWVKEKSYGAEAFEGFEFFKEEIYGDDVFRGIEVYGSDIMLIAAYGYAGIHGKYAVPFVEWNSRDFRPESTEAPSVPIDINDLNLAHLSSPGELRVYDSQGRVTGLVNGEVREEIPYSFSFNNTVVVLAPTDSYHYEIAGTEEGSYGLELISVEEGEATTFTATDIPTITGAIHDYTVDWDVLSRGREGVTVQVDSDGDGGFENTINSDNELTRDEFVFMNFDPDTLNLRSKGKFVTVYIELPGYDVGEIDVSSIKLNGIVPALAKPTQVGDYDNNGVPDLMVKFDRAAVESILAVGEQVDITITGEVAGVGFKGSDSIRVVTNG